MGDGSVKVVVGNLVEVVDEQVCSGSVVQLVVVKFAERGLSRENVT